jgi:hypothetical protein
MSMYSVHLGTGHNLQCKNIKSSTIKAYCLNVATFVCLFDPEKRDPRYSSPLSKAFAICLTKVFNEFSRWEDMPNRREAYSLAMQATLTLMARDCHSDTILPVLRDWFLCMLQAAARRGEWAQPLSCYDILKPALNFKEETMAFTLGNIQFLRVGKHRCTIVWALAHRDQVEHYELTWDTQKNGNNGESKLFSRNNQRPELDCVDAMLRIVARFARILGLDNTTTPLAIFLPAVNSSTPVLITSSEIKTVMQKVAIVTYDFDPSNEKDRVFIARFTGHSLRVGMAVLLQAMGFSAHDIKMLCRWKSEAFMDYLRNLVYVTERVNQAWTDASLIPSL